jgi:hypothetical protein
MRIIIEKKNRLAMRLLKSGAMVNHIADSYTRLIKSGILRLISETS